MICESCGASTEKRVTFEFETEQFIHVYVCSFCGRVYRDESQFGAERGLDGEKYSIPPDTTYIDVSRDDEIE